MKLSLKPWVLLAVAVYALICGLVMWLTWWVIL